MTTKTSQKTEDMLDQTFANFDSEVTGAQTQETQAAPEPKKTKSGNNNMIFIGAGVAAVGVVSYLMIIKPMLQAEAPVQQQVQAPVQQPVQPPVAQTPVQPEVQQPATQSPVAQTPVQPEQVNPLVPQAQAPVQQAVQQPVAQTPIQPEVQQPVQAQAPVQQAVQQPVAQTPIQPEVQQPVQAQAPVQQAVQAPVAQTPVQPEVKQPATQANIPAGNAQSIAVLEELKGMFEQQTNEFKGVLTGIDSRIGNIETTLSEQKVFNEKVSERLDNLESNKKAVKVVVANKEISASDKPIKPVRKAVVVKKSVNKEVSDSNVLVDKSSDSPKVKAEKIEKSNLPKLEFHSVYGGRVWLKNTDGSLSTYTNGDRLPTGEIIKNINDENLEIVTDKRTIKN